MQALVIGSLTGLVLLVFVGGVLLLAAPYEILFPPNTPTPTSSPTVTPTPTFPNFMPTPNLEPPTPVELTPINTRIPTATPSPAYTPTPTTPFRLPTLAFKPTDTPTSPPPPATLPSSPTATLISSRQYSVFFEAVETELVKGDCTDLEWRIQGQVQVWLNNQPVNLSGTREVGPERDTDYVLTTQVAGSPELRRQIIKIFVEEEADNQE
jgi:hypothetical protein